MLQLPIITGLYTNSVRMGCALPVIAVVLGFYCAYVYETDCFKYFAISFGSYLKSVVFVFRMYIIDVLLEERLPLNLEPHHFTE